MYQLIQGDCIESMKRLEAGSVQCCVTSPPYFGLRDYQVDGQIGLEETPEQYVAKLVDVFREVRRLLRDDGTLWLNLGDSYANTGNPGQDFSASKVGYGGKGRGHLGGQPKKIIPEGIKQKDLFGIPWAVAFALRADGWYLRSDIIWSKPNPMPESVTDRPTKAHEYIFLLSKSAQYFYDADAVREAQRGDGRKRGAYAHGPNTNQHVERFVETGYRNRRSVWTVTTKPYSGAHFATFPPDLIEPCILAGSKPGDTVLDCFNGSGTTGAVSLKHGRHYIGLELNPDYIELAHSRITQSQPMLAGIL